MSNNKKKFVAAFVGLGVLALLSWLTLSNQPVGMHDRSTGIDVVIRYRTAALAVMGLFSALTALAFWRARIEEKRDAASEQQQAPHC